MEFIFLLGGMLGLLCVGLIAFGIYGIAKSAITGRPMARGIVTRQAD